jgi:excisionase family DNA binding protein
MDPEKLEGFVDAEEAAKFLSLTRRRVLELARAKKLPGHPLGDGPRRVWRFRLSEIAAAVTRDVFTSDHDPVIRTLAVSRRRDL